MYLSEDIRSYCLTIIKNPLFQQLAPFAVLFVLPVLILFTVQAATATAQNHKSYLLWCAAMVLESFGIGLPWNWSNSHAASGSGHERKKSKKKHVRTRAEQVSANGHTGPGMQTNRIRYIQTHWNAQKPRGVALRMAIILASSTYLGHIAS